MIYKQSWFWDTYACQRRLFQIEGHLLLANTYRAIETGCPFKAELVEQLVEENKSYGYITEKTCFRLYENHANKKIYRIVASAYIRDNIEPALTLQDRDANRMVFVFDDMVYKCSVYKDEIVREILAWVNYPDPLMAPIDFCDRFTVDGETYYLLVMPHIPDSVSESTLFKMLDELDDYNYVTSYDSNYEEDEHATGVPYIILPNGLRVDDASSDNFKILRGRLFIVDYNEVDL